MKKNLLSLCTTIFFLFFSLTTFSQQGAVIKVVKGMKNAQNLVQNAQAKVAEIDAAFKKVKDSGAYKTLVDGFELKFPYAVLPVGGNEDYAIVVNGVGLDPIAGMYAEIFMKIPRGENKYLYFLADKVPLSSSGKILGDLNLYLLKTIDVKVGEGFDVTFKGMDDKNDENSYVTFNCNGFKELFINGRLNFDSKTVLTHDEKKPLSLDFFVNADRLENMIVKFDRIPAVEFKGLPGFVCDIPDLTLDKSDLRNAPSFNLPQWYIDTLKIKDPGLDESIYGSALWQGVYASKIFITIPTKFIEGSGDDSKKRAEKKDGTRKVEETVVIESKHFIVDEYGVTSLTRAISASKNTPIVKGDLKGFKYQIDSLRLNIIASSLSRAGLYGEMSFPICKETSTVEYGITITKSAEEGSGVQYYGYANATINKKLHAEAFGVAQLDINKSQFNLEYKNNQFFPEVILDGKLVVSPKKKKKKTTDTDTKSAGKISLVFNGFAIGSKTPYVSFIGGGAEVDLTSNTSLTII